MDSSSLEVFKTVVSEEGESEVLESGRWLKLEALCVASKTVFPKLVPGSTSVLGKTEFHGKIGEIKLYRCLKDFQSISSSRLLKVLQ